MEGFENVNISHNSQQNTVSYCIIVSIVLLSLLAIFGYPICITIYLLSNDDVYDEYYNIDYNNYAYEKYNIMILMNWALWLAALLIFIKTMGDLIKSMAIVGTHRFNFVNPNKDFYCKIITIIVFAITYLITVITGIILVNKYIEPYIELYKYSAYNIMMYVGTILLLINIMSCIMFASLFVVKLLLMLKSSIC